jgi:hypothetical protein
MSIPQREPRLLRLYLGLFALAALTVLLVAARLRYLVRAPQEERVRDVTWLPRGR